MRLVLAYICSICSTCALVRCRLISDGGVLSWFGTLEIFRGGGERKEGDGEEVIAYYVV
jgi:hypothetical protein